MKKIFTLALALLMLAGLAVGCTKGPVADNGKNAIMVVSFGTSYADTRELTIEATENRFREEYPDYEIVRAFTAQTIIDILEERDGIEVYNVQEAFDYLKKEGYTNVLLQPLLIMNGAEFDDMAEIADLNAENFATVKIGASLLTSESDYDGVVSAMKPVIGNLADDEAFIFMGHGTHHYANATYAAMEYKLQDAGLGNVFVGTVEGFPTIDDVLERLEGNNIRKVTLAPFMLVAGDHAQNDMAGDEEESWNTILKKEGYEVEFYLHGLGESKEIQELYLTHAKHALAGEH